MNPADAPSRAMDQQIEWTLPKPTFHFLNRLWGLKQKIGPGDRWPQLSSDLHETPNMHFFTSYHL